MRCTSKLTLPLPLPSDGVSILSKRARVHYISGLGHLGLGQNEIAKDEFENAIRISPDHLGANTALNRRFLLFAHGTKV